MKPNTTEVKLLASVKDAHAALKPMLEDMEQARKLLSQKKAPKMKHGGKKSKLDEEL